ncbi:MAG: hypothetical protein U0599_13585 [Vicinamibacteria bacterium]
MRAGDGWTLRGGYSHCGSRSPGARSSSTSSPRRRGEPGHGGLLQVLGDTQEISVAVMRAFEKKVKAEPARGARPAVDRAADERVDFEIGWSFGIRK